MKGLKRICKFIRKGLISLSFLLLTLVTVGVGVFFIYANYIRIRDIAPTICTIPNPVPLEVEIFKLDTEPSGILEQTQEKYFFADCKAVVAKFYDDEVVFWKHGSKTGRLKKYTFAYAPHINGEIFFRKLKNVDIESSAIGLEFEYDVNHFLGAIMLFCLIIFLVYLFFVYFIRSLKRTFKLKIKQKGESF